MLLHVFAREGAQASAHGHRIFLIWERTAELATAAVRMLAGLA